MKASKRDELQAVIDTVKSELSHTSHLLGKTQACIRKLDDAARANADLVREITKSRYSGIYQRLLGVTNRGFRSKVSHRDAGRYIRTATRTLKAAETRLAKKFKEATERRITLEAALRRR